MSERISIGRINSAEIYAVKNESGETYVPIKPICEAIGVDVEPQRKKINEDETLNSVAVLNTATGSDGKQYEMMCLPLRYVYGWIFSIHPSKVSPEAKEVVLKYRKECYDALYDHFTRSMRRTIEENNAEIEILKRINSAITDEKEAKTRRKKAEDDLSKIRAARLDPNPSIFD